MKIKKLKVSLRGCRPCTACCKPIQLQGKGVNETCKFVSEKGNECTQWKGRPINCHNFTCSWRDGIGFPTDRPDRLGVFLCFVATAKYGTVAHLYEAREGARYEDKVIRYEKRLKLSEAYLTLIHHYNDIETVTVMGGPTSILSRYREDMIRFKV